MKLRAKVQIFLSIFMLFVILLINSTIYFLYEKEVMENESNRVKENTENIMEALNESNTAEITSQDVLEAFLPVNGLIRVIGEDGNIIHNFAKEDFFHNWPFSYVTSEVENFEKNTSPSYLQISVPIIWSDGSIVTLQVSEALYSMDEALTTLQFTLLITSAFMLILVLIAGYILANYLTKPLQTFTKAIRNNTKNNKWNKIKLNSKSNDEIKEMQHAYNAMIDQIETNKNKQQQFVSDASHELKTPLSVILSYAELLKRRGKDRPELLEEATEAIISESGRMKSLTEQMLALAKNENQENILFEQVPIVSITKDVIRSLSTAYGRSISLYNKLDSETVITADRAKLLQTIYILVDNACKYSEKEVEIHLYSENAYLKLSVIDQGDGLTEEDISHIFERFYRVDKARNRKIGGSGLGLAICQQIVSAHGGSIDVSSELGEGTTFTIQLPI